MDAQIVNDLKDLKALLDSHVITDEEFSKMKQQILRDDRKETIAIKKVSPPTEKNSEQKSSPQNNQEVTYKLVKEDNDSWGPFWIGVGLILFFLSLIFGKDATWNMLMNFLKH